MIRALFIAVILFIIGLPMESFSARSQIGDSKVSAQLIKCKVFPFNDETFADCTQFGKDGKNYGGNRGFVDSKFPVKSISMTLGLYDHSGQLKSSRGAVFRVPEATVKTAVSAVLFGTTKELKSVMNYNFNDSKQKYFPNVNKYDTIKITHLLLDKNMPVYDLVNSRLQQKGVIGGSDSGLRQTECFYQKYFPVLVERKNQSSNQCKSVPFCAAMLKCVKKGKYFDLQTSCPSLKGTSGSTICPSATDCFNTAKKFKRKSNAIKNVKTQDAACFYYTAGFFASVDIFEDSCGHTICTGKASCSDDAESISADVYAICDADAKGKCPSPAKCLTGSYCRERVELDNESTDECLTGDTLRVKPAQTVMKHVNTKTDSSESTIKSIEESGATQ